MPTFGERVGSIELSDTGARMRYIVRDEPDPFIAKGLIESTTPTMFGDFERVDVRVEEMEVPDGDAWEVEVEYRLPTQQTSEPQQGESIFTFDTGGGTQHITQSLATVGMFAALGQTAPNFQSAIGVTVDSVEGVDIVVPVYQFSETHVLPNAVVNDAYKNTVMLTTGRVNNASFRGFAAGSVLFLGASGTKRGSPSGVGDWEITFRFAVSPNQVGLSVGPITGISKKGWEYLWARYEDTEDAGAQTIVKRPIAAYVERVYLETSFSGLGI